MKKSKLPNRREASFHSDFVYHLSIFSPIPGEIKFKAPKMHYSHVKTKVTLVEERFKRSFSGQKTQGRHKNKSERKSAYR